MGFADGGADTARRFFVGIGVGSYDDPALNLPRAVQDVLDVAEWFTARSGIAHERALPDLADSPETSQVTKSLRNFLAGGQASDVVVIYVACHGELEGGRAYLFGRDTPRQGLAGLSIEPSTLGSILGQSKPHNILLIIDACVAGRLGSAIQRAAEDTADELNSRDAHRPHAQVVISSTYGRDPALDGRFARAFLRVVSDERWTGTTSRWIDIDHLIRGLNEELRDIAPTQVAERRVWGSGAAELIPNPNMASRRLSQLIADEEFAAHFDPSARGVARGESGTFFTGRVRELRRIVTWLDEPPGTAIAGGAPQAAPIPDLLVITGSPGSGKSALLARTAVLSDPARRPAPDILAGLPGGTVPRAGALKSVVWCHNKTERQIIEQIAAAMGGVAATPEALLRLAAGASGTIAVDALDEVAGGQARQVASRVLRSLATGTGIRLLVATRRRPVRDEAGGKADLLDHLGPEPATVIDLDRSPDTRSDLRDYVEARIAATTGGREPAMADLAGRIADAAGNSFLVAAIAARLAATGKLTPRADGTLVLPTEVGEALAGYIDSLPDSGKARGLLRPLAWAQGAGLPWGTLWPHLGTALAWAVGAPPPHREFDDRDVRELLEVAGDLITESVEAGQPVYRLFHEALAEHLRADMDQVSAHRVLAHAMLEQAGGRPWRHVQRYVSANLPVHLLGAGRAYQLLGVLTDPAWDRDRREETGDPLAAVGVADATIERILGDSPTDLRAVSVCVAYSRAMTTAAPLILDVLARSGQLARAEAMANNLAYAPDRMLAYRYLCGVYARERNATAARRCVEEVRRSLTAVPQAHQPMAWYWVAEAAVDAGLAEGAREAAQAALASALQVQGDGWDLPNGYFWAARACNLAGLEAGTVSIRATLDALEPAMSLRNQALQAASASRHRRFLERQLGLYFDGARHPTGMVRDGNMALALALAAAGLEAEADQVFALVGAEAPRGEADSRKRWAWALAVRGRMAGAIAALGHIGDPIETGKAIARIAAVADERADHATLDALVPHAERLLDGYEPRSQARLIRMLWTAGRRADALARAEQEIAAGHARQVMADPRDESGPAEALSRMSPGRPVKVARREMVTSVVPVQDEQWCRDVEYEAARGALDKARERLADIALPVSRARALAAIAKHDPDPERGLASWLRGLADARRAGRGVVDELRPLGSELLRRAGRSARARALEAEIAALDARWDLESFSEQYATLRSTRPSGADRTRRMTGLLLVPHRLAHTHRWTHNDIRAAWASDEDGKRLFALALIEAKPELAIVDVLVAGIRASRSAFEQYQALLSAGGATLEGEAAAAVRAAVEAEIRGDPRADGVDAALRADPDRMALAQRLLERLRAD